MTARRARIESDAPPPMGGVRMPKLPRDPNRARADANPRNYRTVVQQLRAMVIASGALLDEGFDVDAIRARYAELRDVTIAASERLASLDAIDDALWDGVETR